MTRKREKAVLDIMTTLKKNKVCTNNHAHKILNKKNHIELKINIQRNNTDSSSFKKKVVLKIKNKNNNVNKQI